MARGRMINKTLAKSGKFNRLSSDFSRLLYCMMIPFTDREGRLDGDPCAIRSDCFPKRRDVTIDDVQAALVDLDSTGLIALYSVGDDQYVEISQFKDNQSGMKYDRETGSNIPPPDQYRSDAGVMPDQYRSDAGVMPDMVRPNVKEVKLKEVKVKEEGGNAPRRFTPPTIQEVKDYGREYTGKRFADAERFVDFYTSKGWMVGKAKMKDWKAALRNWARKDSPSGPDSKDIEEGHRRRERERKEIQAEKAGVDIPSMMDGIIATRATEEFKEA